MADFSKLKVVDLKTELKIRGLPQNGLKAALVARLIEFEATHPDWDGSAPPTASENQDAVAEPNPTAPPDQISTMETNSMDPSVPPAPPRDEAAEDKEITDDTVEQAAPDVGQNDAVDDNEINHTVEPPTEDLETTDKQSPEVDPPPLPQSSPAAAAEKMDLDDAPPALEEHSKRKRSKSPTPTAEISRKRARQSSGEPVEQENDAEVGQSRDIDMKDGDATVNGDEGHADQKPLPETGNSLDEHDQIRPDDSPPLQKSNRVDTDAPQPDLPRSPSRSLSPQRHKPAAATRQFPGLESSSNANDELTRPEMDIDREVEPALHSATPALYIKNFKRPLRPSDVRAHLSTLATSATSDEPEEVVEFYLDRIRTHAFAVFRNISAASRVRSALHNTIWPEEKNRMPLWVDFIPAEKVDEWIAMEEGPTDGRSYSGSRWAVVYEEDEGGNMVARLDAGDNPPPAAPRGGRAPVPTAPRGDPFGVNAIPVGPRADRLAHERPSDRGHESRQRDNQYPGSRMGPGTRRTGPPGQLGERITTRASPSISYQLVSEDIARQRLKNLRSYYGKEGSKRDWGREINRYTFEDGIVFVDRGREIFEGIRPPRGGRGGGGGGRRFGPPGGPRGRGSFRSRSDRYFPGPGGGGGRFDDGGGRSQRHQDIDRPRFNDQYSRDGPDY